MSVAPFDLGACPSVRAADAAATRSALRVLAMLPPRWQVNLPPFDSAILTVAGPDFDTRGSDPSGAIVLPIARGADLGRLTLASSFAARLVDAALGARGTFSAARALGPAERGILVALIAPALDAMGWSLALGPAPAVTGARAHLVLRIEGPFGTVALGLDLPANAQTSQAAIDRWRSRAGDLPVVARVELAATELRAASLIGLGLGDALVFDGRQSAEYLEAGADRSWEGRLVVGAYVAPLRIDPRGALALAGDFQMTGTPLERTIVINRGGAMDVSGPTEKATSVLAAAPIEIVAELARVTLRGDEVLGLTPGVVLTVAADRRQAIALRIGGEIWAEGELVDVEGELGVRVTRLLRTER